MTLAGTSAPASGGEHLISHALDMLSAIDGLPHDLHGRQVGVGSILASELYRRVLEVESPTLTDAHPNIDRIFWGPLADTVAAQYAQKQSRLKSARNLLTEGDRWDQLRSTLATMLRPPQNIQSCLAAAGGAWQARHIKCEKNRLLDAFVHAHEIRSRFTILDLAMLMGIMPQTAAEIIDEWG
jgi:glycerol-1-phosphate dehydrogenase [NAD(P)+]